MLRREFIGLLSTALAGCATIPGLTSFADRPKYWIQAYQNRLNGKAGILIFDLEKSLISQVDTKFYVHKVFFDSDSGEFIGINKYGPQYLKFLDLNFKQLKYYQTDEKQYNLSGHVTSAPGDKHYYLTAIDSTGNSCILKLDKITNTYFVGANLGKTDPPAHNCKLGYDPKEIIVTSGNKIHFFNRFTGELISKNIALASPKSSLRHFSIGKNNNICIQSNIIDTEFGYSYSKAQVVLYSEQRVKTELTASISEKIKNNELLDFEFDSTGRFFAGVHGGSALLSIWSTKPFQFVNLLKFDEIIVRVSSYPGENNFIVLGRENFYSVDTNSFLIKKINHKLNPLNKNYRYSHKTLLNITV